MFKTLSALIIASVSAADLQTATPEEFPTKAVINTLAGLLYVFFAENNLPHIQACATGLAS